LPPGFAIEAVDPASLKLNGRLVPQQCTIDPKRARPSDLFRGFHASFEKDDVDRILQRTGDRALRLNGSLKNGSRIEGWCTLPAGTAGGHRRTSGKDQGPEPPGTPGSPTCD